MALGDINIKASYINVNGLIQSGLKSYLITIPNGAGANGSLTINKDGTATSTHNSSSGLSAYTYNSATDTYTLNPIFAGGNVYLSGTVLNNNTGYGTIAIYNNPDITVSNLSTSTLVVQAINTGTTVIGGIFINNVKQTGNSYTPTTRGIKFNFLVGSTTGFEKYDSYTVAKYLGFIDAFWPDSSSFNLQSTKITNNTPLPGVNGFMSSIPGNVAPYLEAQAKAAANLYHAPDSGYTNGNVVAGTLDLLGAVRPGSTVSPDITGSYVIYTRKLDATFKSTRRYRGARALSSGTARTPDSARP